MSDKLECEKSEESRPLASSEMKEETFFIIFVSIFQNLLEMKSYSMYSFSDWLMEFNINDFKIHPRYYMYQQFVPFFSVQCKDIEKLN